MRAAKNTSTCVVGLVFARKSRLLGYRLLAYCANVVFFWWLVEPFLNAEEMNRRDCGSSAALCLRASHGYLTDWDVFCMPILLFKHYRLAVFRRSDSLVKVYDSYGHPWTKREEALITQAVHR